LRVFLTKSFVRFQRKEKISDAALNEAITRAEHGQVDATLGRQLIKQRIGRAGQGRSGGYRTVIAYRFGDRAIFLFGFAKSDRGNVSPADEIELAATGAALLAFDQVSIRKALLAGELKEITDEAEA
jgi:hypothetical protein